MIIGIDGSRSFKKEKTGTEDYSYSLIKEIFLLEKFQKNRSYYLYSKIKENPYPEINIVSNEFIPGEKLWTQYRLAKRLFSKTPDLLFVPAHTLPIVRPTKMKTLVTIHDLGFKYLKEYHQFPHKLYLNKTTEYVLKKADHLIAVSESTKREILKNSKREENSISIIHESCNKELFDYQKILREKNNKEEFFNKYQIKNKYFLFVGTIQPRKNIASLIKAFANLKKTDLELLIIGKKGWLYENILSLPQELGIEHKVKFLGYVPDEDLPYLYHYSLGFVFPSLYEGFGVPLLEAMASGCPVITSNLSSMPEVAGDSAIFVDPYNEEEISQKMNLLYERESLRLNLINRGLNRVKKFSWEKAAQETIRVFQKMQEKNEQSN